MAFESLKKLAVLGDIFQLMGHIFSPKCFLITPLPVQKWCENTVYEYGSLCKNIMKL